MYSGNREQRAWEHGGDLEGVSVARAVAVFHDEAKVTIEERLRGPKHFSARLVFTFDEWDIITAAVTKARKQEGEDRLLQDRSGAKAGAR
jgi:hypothetical protein